MASGAAQTIGNDTQYYIGSVRTGGKLLVSVLTNGASVFFGNSRADIALIGGNNQGYPITQAQGSADFDWEGDVWVTADVLHAKVQAVISIV